MQEYFGQMGGMHMIEMEHIQQKNDGINWKCGAVSLEMILNYYGITCEQDEIWDAVKSVRPTRNNQYYALTYQLAQYAIQKGLCATIYKADYDSCLHILDYFDEINRPIIMSVTQKKSGDSHFTIYTGKKYGYYTFNDPKFAELRSCGKQLLGWYIDKPGLNNMLNKMEATEVKF